MIVDPLIRRDRLLQIVKLKVLISSILIPFESRLFFNIQKASFFLKLHGIESYIYFETSN